MTAERPSPYLCAANYFICLRCNTLHGFMPGGEGAPYLMVMRIEQSHRYVDCTAWNCPHCGAAHDSRQDHGDMFGFRTHATYVPADPTTGIEMLRTRDGGWAFVDDGRIFSEVTNGWPVHQKARRGTVRTS